MAIKRFSFALNNDTVTVAIRPGSEPGRYSDYLCHAGTQHTGKEVELKAFAALMGHRGASWGLG